MQKQEVPKTSFRDLINNNNNNKKKWCKNNKSPNFVWGLNNKNNNKM